jgi:protoheme IX farnesyltransferase
MGNIFTASAGFFLASQGLIDFKLLLAFVVGVCCINGSGCVFNNYLDRDIDRHMQRTKYREGILQRISEKNVLIYGVVLILLGITILSWYTNLLTTYLGIFGFFAYVVVYGYFKRTSVHGTIIGSISGAIPPLAGYTAVSNRIDLPGILLFLILVFWQMPHFYAIALFRLEDYKAAKIPVLPVVKGVAITRWQILFFLLAFIISVLALPIFGFTGIVYLVIMSIISAIWFGLGIRGFWLTDTKIWARKMFLFSLITITVFCVLVSLRL